MNIISGLNECATLFQWVRSAISSLRSQRNEVQDQKLEEDVLLQLQSDLQCLQDTLPSTYNLIDRAEWRIHDRRVADLLSKLKHAAYDADDLLDEFRWHELKVKTEGNATQLQPFIDFFHSVIKRSFNKVTEIQRRLNNLSNELKEMGFHQATPRFDKSVRHETSSFLTEAEIFGRDKEMNELIRLLGVPVNSRKRTRSQVVGPTNNRMHPSRRKIARTRDGSSTSNQAYTKFSNNNETMTSVPVLPIVGIGGVGKTTLAQNICSQVKSHFVPIIWLCVSDDFDVKRLTKEAIEQSSGKAPMTDNLNSLQGHLADSLNERRFLIVLDDIWDENGECWKRFCAPFKNVLQGSMILVTTRSQVVADIVGTMNSFPLDGLKDDVYWKFFELCVFGPGSSKRDSELERIGKEISKKLGGSPLAAKTLGRLLGISCDTTHWNNILTSELWEHDQEETEILPALRLSYMYLPFHLKRCFSFCAVYPKDHNFEKTSLAEMWVAEGFIVPEGNIPLQYIGSRYFQDLVDRSFFQKHRSAYVIHDLMHDMAQLVSKEDCFIVKNACDIEKVPQNVRHLSILPITNVECPKLSSLRKCTKLRTLLCNKPLSSAILSSAMDHWFKELSCLRVIFCASTQKLPESIGNLKHLRYLEISRKCRLEELPSSFCSLYNLQILYATKCKIKKLPRGINKLRNLKKFETNSTKMEVDAADGEEQIRFINKFCKDTRDLTIYNLGAISKDRAAQVELSKMEYLNSLTLKWPSLCPEHNETEVLQALQPPTNIKSVCLNGYPGEYLPSWFRELPAVTVDGNNARVGTIFESVTDLRIEGCQKLSSLQQFLQSTYAPAIRKIVIVDCISLTSVPTERFKYSDSFEEMNLYKCPNITHLLAPSLKKLMLQGSGNLGDIDCTSLTNLDLSQSALASIELQKWSLPVLEELNIRYCTSLTIIRESEHISTDHSRRSTRGFPSLTHLRIKSCDELESIDDLMTHECLPAIQSIEIYGCSKLSLPTKRFGHFSSLKNLEIKSCKGIYWQSGTVFPPALQTLKLDNCGDISAWSPSCLENLASLESLEMVSCKGIYWQSGTVFPPALQTLTLMWCGDFSDWSPSCLKNLTSLTSLEMFSCKGLSIPDDLRSHLKSLRYLNV